MKLLSTSFGILFIALFLAAPANNVAYAGDCRKQCEKKCKTTCVEKCNDHKQLKKEQQCIDQRDHCVKTPKSEKEQDLKKK